MFCIFCSVRTRIVIFDDSILHFQFSVFFQNKFKTTGSEIFRKWKPLLQIFHFLVKESIDPRSKSEIEMQYFESSSCDHSTITGFNFMSQKIFALQEWSENINRLTENRATTSRQQRYFFLSFLKQRSIWNFFCNQSWRFLSHHD